MTAFKRLKTKPPLAPMDLLRDVEYGLPWHLTKAFPWAPPKGVP